MLIAVDTGGTKTLVAQFGASGDLVRSVKFPTPKDTAGYISELVHVINEVADGAKPSAIVVGLPGQVKDGVALWCHHLGWSNFDVRRSLGHHFKVPILVENDANLAGLAETRALSITPVSALYVTISTGIGTGFTVRGKLDDGLRHCEGGHAMVEFDGRVREWESFAAGSAIYKAYGKYARDITSTRTWRQIADRISRGFLALIPFAQPEVIIIGGSIGSYFDNYSEQLNKLLIEKLPSHINCPRIVQATHPEEAVVYGCYYHGIDELAA